MPDAGSIKAFAVYYEVRPCKYLVSSSAPGSTMMILRVAVRARVDWFATSCIEQ